MVESEIGRATDWTPGVGGHGAVLAFSWLPWRYGEIKSRRDGPRTGNRHFSEKSEILILLILVKILKKSDSTHSSSKGAVNAYFLTGSFSKKTWLFEAVVLVC